MVRALNRLDFAIYTPGAEAGCDNDAIEVGQPLRSAFRRDGFAVNPVHLNINLQVCTRVNQGFRDGFVAVLQFDVFAYQSDFDLVLGCLYWVRNFFHD